VYAYRRFGSFPRVARKTIFNAELNSESMNQFENEINGHSLSVSTGGALIGEGKIITD
jgi:hypothetical protein